MIKFTNSLKALRKVFSDVFRKKNIRKLALPVCMLLIISTLLLSAFIKPIKTTAEWTPSDSFPTLNNLIKFPVARTASIPSGDHTGYLYGYDDSSEQVIEYRVTDSPFAVSLISGKYINIASTAIAGLAVNNWSTGGGTVFISDKTNSQILIYNDNGGTAGNFGYVGAVDTSDYGVPGSITWAASGHMLFIAIPSENLILKYDTNSGVITPNLSIYVDNTVTAITAPYYITYQGNEVFAMTADSGQNVFTWYVLDSSQNKTNNLNNSSCGNSSCLVHPDQLFSDGSMSYMMDTNTGRLIIMSYYGSQYETLELGSGIIGITGFDYDGSSNRILVVSNDFVYSR